MQAIQITFVVGTYRLGGRKRPGSSVQDVLSRKNEPPVMYMYRTFAGGRPASCHTQLEHQWASQNCPWEQLCDTVDDYLAVDKF